MQKLPESSDRKWGDADAEKMKKIRSYLTLLYSELWARNAYGWKTKNV